MKRRKRSPYIELCKPGIVIMVLVTCALGFVLGSDSSPDLILLLWTLIGTGLSAAGGAALNHYMERDLDALMPRTINRPLVTGKISPLSALSFGTALVVLGLTILYFQVNLLTTFLSALTVGLYLLVYTPMKRLSGWNTFVGAIPGALPPVGGWTAASGTLDPEAWLLFAILFVWQHPHFFAIAWLYRDDYAKAGFKMLPCLDNEQSSKTVRQTMIFSCLLVPVSILPATVGMFSSSVYLIGAIALSVMMLTGGITFSKKQNRETARALLFSSLIYLPALFLCIIADVLITWDVLI